MAYIYNSRVLLGCETLEGSKVLRKKMEIIFGRGGVEARIDLELSHSIGIAANIGTHIDVSWHLTLTRV